MLGLHSGVGLAVFGVAVLGVTSIPPPYMEDRMHTISIYLS